MDQWDYHILNGQAERFAKMFPEDFRTYQTRTENFRSSLFCFNGQVRRACEGSEIFLPFRVSKPKWQPDITLWIKERADELHIQRLTDPVRHKSWKSKRPSASTPYRGVQNARRV